MEVYKGKQYENKKEKGKNLLYALFSAYVISNPEDLVSEDGLSKNDLEKLLKILGTETDLKE